MTVPSIRTLAALLTVALSSPIGAQHVRQSLGVCDARVDGENFPLLVPAHLVWNELWDRASGGGGNASRRQALAQELNLPSSILERIDAAAAGRVGYLAARTIPDEDKELSAADASLDARDRLLATLDAESADKVRQWARETAARPYQLGVTGELTRTADGKLVCKASINGADRPELIPEWDAWRNYFTFMSRSAQERRGNEGGFSAEYLRALQRHHLPIPLTDIERVLNMAIEADTEIVSIENVRNISGEERLDQIVRTTMKTRARIRDEMSNPSWAAIHAEVNRVRRSTIFDYPGFDESGRGDR